MATFLFNVVTKLGKLIKGGENVTGDEARTIALAFAKRNGYQPQILAIVQEQAENLVEPDTIAVADQIWYVDVARFVYKHQRALHDVDVTKTARDGTKTSWRAKYHWSSILKTGLAGGELKGIQPEWLTKRKAEIKLAIASRKELNKTYLILDPDAPEFSF